MPYRQYLALSTACPSSYCDWFHV